MIEEYFTFIIGQLDMGGFLETRASLGIDIIVTFLVLLPILSTLSIMLAINKHLKFHQFTQFLLFFLSLIFLIYFAYLVHYKEGFALILEQSSITYLEAFLLLIIHVLVVMVTLTLWALGLMYAVSDKRRRALPGVYSQSHARAGKRIFKAILLTALTSAGIYWMLYVA